MDTLDSSSREAHWLFLLGAFLILLSMFVGLALAWSVFPNLLLGLAAHVGGMIQGIMVIAFGVLWPRLKLSRTLSAIGFWLVVYSQLISFGIQVLTALWDAGGELFRLAGSEVIGANPVQEIMLGAARGSPLQEQIIYIGLGTALLAALVAQVIIIWGLWSSVREEKKREATLVRD